MGTEWKFMEENKGQILIYGDCEASQLPVLKSVFDDLQIEYRDTLDGITQTLDLCNAGAIVLGQHLSDCSSLDACRLLSRSEPYTAIPIVVLGDEFNPRLGKYLEAGIADYIVTPVREEELKAKLHYHMQRTASPIDADLFRGRYEQVQLLGEGGFGSVYLALDHSTPELKQVALKTYEIIAGDSTFRSRYLQEVFQLSRLRHPNIARLIDFGKNNTHYFIVTEYVDGETLSDALEQFGAISEMNAALIGYYVGLAIQHMANTKIVHRDLNPKNIMLTSDGDVKVIDFGLAKTVQAATLSTEDQLHGTPFYLAPEYIQDEEVSPKTDIYSLAVTLYYALTGEFPFPGETAAEVVQAHLEHTPLSLSVVIPEINPRFSELIDQSLARDPVDRPSVSAFVAIMKETFESY